MKIIVADNIDLNKIAYIYALVDPRTNITKYIGQTVNLKSRYKSHISEGRHGTKTYKRNWIKSLLNLNLKPIMIVLETIDNKKLKYEDSILQFFIDEREKWYIFTLNKYGTTPLTNTTEGGKGMDFSTRQKHSKRMKIKNPAIKKSILQYDLEGNFINKFESLEAAKNKIGGKSIGGIRNSANGKSTAYGYFWKFETKNFPLKIDVSTTKLHLIRPICQYDKDMNLIEVFPSMRKVDKVGYNSTCVSRVCSGQAKTHKGYIWKYKE